MERDQKRSLETVAAGYGRLNSGGLERAHVRDLRRRKGPGVAMRQHRGQGTLEAKDR